ncbi:MAG: hypothetical protein AAFQ42_06995 [Pseudomonadota bacterium]
MFLSRLTTGGAPAARSVSYWRAGAVLFSFFVFGVALLPTASADAASRCTRAPLSDIAFGKEATIKQALSKLDEYAKAIAEKRGWPSDDLVRSREESSCEVFLNLGPLGTEYRCLVTATYCVR